LVAGRSRAVQDGIRAESMSLEDLIGQDAAAAKPSAVDVADRVEATLEQTLKRVPPDEIGDPREFRRALDLLLREAKRTARKLDDDPGAPLSRGEAIALEAVIRTDGTRPTLLVRDDAVDAEHPLARDWSQSLRDTQEPLRDRVRAVGRIEPANATARSFFGTGWVIDAGKGLVLTNLHVLEAMWRRLPHVMVRTATGFRILDGAFIDFAGESGRTRTDRFRVVEATASGIDGPGFARLDAAVLKVEPTRPDQEMPPAIPVVADSDGPRGNLPSLCVVGFPGPPAFTSGVHEGVDWGWVNATLFGNRFGVKRLAPGVAHRPLGSLDGDTRGWVFGHDPTTLGGSSGSPALAWLDNERGAFGLHFAGASVDTNCAHAFAASAEELRKIGVPVREPSGG
jgi:V8-like Glu-specific endopeptidase